MKKTLLWLGLGAAALGLWSSTFVVAEGEVAVVARLGDPRRVVTDAGLHFKWPAPLDGVTLVDRRVHVLDPEPGEYLTNDNTNVIVDPFVAWRVADPRQFLVSMRDREGAERRLEDVLTSSVKVVLNRGPFEDLVSKSDRERDLDDVVGELTEEVARRVLEDGFGVEVRIAGIKRVNFPESNKTSVFDRMRSEREEAAEQIRSEGRKEAAQIRAQTDVEVSELLGDAEAEAMRIRGEATAEAAALMAEAWDRDPELARFLRSAEVFEALQEGSEIVLRADDPLLKMFDPATLAPPAEEGDGE